MAELMASPYNLGISSVVDAKISASNKVGNGLENLNTPCTGEVTEVWVLPCKPAKPELVLDEDDTTMKMTVKWEGCSSTSEITYKLYWDAGIQTPNQNNFTFLTETRQKNEYTVDTMGIDSRFFNYYVEAINPCGSLKSDILHVERRTPPPPVLAVKVSGSCKLEVQVRLPEDDGGYPINGGNWQVKNGLGEWADFPHCKTESELVGKIRTCRFSMR